jgi:hypothetical protein
MEEKSSIGNPQINDQIVKTEAAPIDKKFRFSRKMLALLSVFCILILVLVVSGGAYVMNSNKTSEITPTPTFTPTPTSSPSATPTLIPTAAKITSKPIATPTPAKKPPLIITLRLPKTGVTEQTKVVTVVNTSTGASFTRSTDSYMSFYDLADGNYRISVNDVPDHKTASATCDHDCEPQNYNYQNDTWSNSREISVDSKAARGVQFYWVPNSAVPR